MDVEKVIKGVHDARRYLEDREWVDKSAGVHIDALNDVLALLKEQETAYQGAVELLRQKTILFDDAIKRLKEQEIQPKTVPEELKLKMWNALYAVEDKFEEKYIGTKEQDSWFLIYRPWLQEGFDLAIKAIADWEGQ